MGEKPKVPDADETRRQYVQQESAQELIDRQSHQALLILLSGIAPAESNDAIGERDEAVVRDCHSMGVLAEIAERMLRTAKRSLRINHPFGTEQRTKPGRERFRILERGECSVEAKLMPGVQCLQAFHEFATEDFFENIHREEKLLLRLDPS